MAWKYKEGTTDKGWVIQINYNGDVNNVTMLKDRVSNQVYWCKPEDCVINLNDQDYTTMWRSVGLRRTSSHEPIVAQYSQTNYLFRTGCTLPDPTDSNNDYAKHLFYADKVTAVLSPGDGFYYYTPTAGELSNGQTFSVCGPLGVLKVPLLYNTFNFTYNSLTGISGATVRKFNQSTHYWNLLTNPGTYATVKAYDQICVSVPLNQVETAYTPGVHWFPVNLTSTAQDKGHWWEEDTDTNNVSQIVAHYFDYYTTGYRGRCIPAIASPVTATPYITYTAQMYYGSFYKVQGNLYIYNSGTQDLNNAYWFIDKTQWPTTWPNIWFNDPFQSKIHSYDSGDTSLERYALNETALVTVHNQDDSKFTPTAAVLYFYLKDNTGSYVPSTNGTQWDVISGTRYAQNTIYGKSVSTTTLNNYVWDLGNIDFVPYYRVAFGTNSSSININEVYTTSQGTIGTNISNTVQYFYCRADSTFEIDVVSDYDTDLDCPAAPIYLVNYSSYYPKSSVTLTRFTVNGNTWWGRFDGNAPTGDCSFYFYSPAITYYSLTHSIMDELEKARTVYSASRNYCWQCVDIGINNGITGAGYWDAFQGQLWGHWGSDSSSQLTTYTNCGDSRVYYTGKRLGTNTLNTYYLDEIRTTDILGTHNFQLNQSKIFGGYYATTKNSGILTPTWTLSQTNIKQTIVPANRNTYTTGRKICSYLNSPVTNGNVYLKNLSDLFALQTPAPTSAPLHQNLWGLITSTSAWVTAPSNWNGTGGTPTTVTVINQSYTNPSDSDYTATDYLAQDYAYGTGSARIIYISSSYTSQYYGAPLAPVIEFSTNYFGLTGVPGDLASYFFRVYNPNNYSVSITGSGQFYITSSGSEWTSNFYPYGGSIAANSYMAWRSTGDYGFMGMTGMYPDYATVGMNIAFQANSKTSQVTSVYYEFGEDDWADLN